MYKNIKKILKNKRIKIMLILVIILLFLIIIFMPKGLLNIIKNAMQKEEIYSFDYEIRGYDVNKAEYSILINITNPEGIERIQYPNNEMSLTCNGKKKLSIDYITKDMKEYEFIITLSTGEVKNEIIEFERPRTGKGTYKKVKGLYVNTPNVDDGLEKEYTRYLNVTDDGILQPANWITDEEPDNWYDYKNQKWANIYVENNGVASYYVWIPRYAYKISENNVAGNERTDVKFIDVYNNYTDPDTDQVITWEQLEAQGYRIPEAFEFGNYNEISISGYWMSKYELSDLDKYVIDYNLTASVTEFNVSNFSTNTDKEISKYTYAINGKIEHETTSLEDYLFTNSTPDANNTINVTALDANGRIIGSMTKTLELTEVNEPDLTGFDPDTTFYVYYDEDGNEHSEIPISQSPPDNWYNYTYASWANIVIRNNGLENYMVWIPRYQYSLDQTSQRTSIRFIKGVTIDTENGYQIPEAFTTETDQGEVELKGYWISKYELSTEQVEAKLHAEMAASGNLIRIKDILGTAITDAETNSTQLKFEYYLNGEKKHEGTSSTENYVYDNLNTNTTYTVNIIVREVSTNKHVGAITKKITTKKANSPELIGLDENRTYYVLYDDSGNMSIGDKIKTDGSNIPDNWYDYSESKWANIVVTDGEIQNGQITNETTISYFVWIPRYEYRILADRDNESTSNRRVEINFIEGTDTQTNDGYQIPEAFTWENGDEKRELLGYWISKYELSE